jgi:hypothetical protein
VYCKSRRSSENVLWLYGTVCDRPMTAGCKVQRNGGSERMYKQGIGGGRETCDSVNRCLPWAGVSDVESRRTVLSRQRGSARLVGR